MLVVTEQERWCLKITSLLPLLVYLKETIVWMEKWNSFVVQQRGKVILMHLLSYAVSVTLVLKTSQEEKLLFKSLEAEIIVGY